jgi:hypothetical protein
MKRQNISGFLQPVKDNLGLRTPSIYRIHCECGKVYIWQAGCSVATRLKEHQCNNKLEHLERSAVADHSVDSRHHTQFHYTSILAT